METKKIRYFIFLRDVSILSLTCFGGPQTHLMLFIERLVKKHNYLTETELMEMLSLCQLLPGPTSTQTITAIGFRLGGPKLAYLTLLVWLLPASIFMGIVALGVLYFDQEIIKNFTQFIKPMGIAFVFVSAFSIGQKVINTKTAWLILILSIAAGLMYQSPYMAPIAILFGGLITSFKYRNQEKKERSPIKIEWANFFLWASFLVVLPIIGKITHWLPIRILENFYRNGSLAFGGGQILKPLLYNEFVEFKHWLSADEFLSGIALSEIVPGPTFSIASYVGSLSMRSGGIPGQIVGSIMASIGIFAPGIFLIFFVIRFWDQMKQYRGIRASIEGINATSTGLTIAAGISLYLTAHLNTLGIITLIITILAMLFTKTPNYIFIFIGLLMGLFFI